ncbi:hypothetical protein PGB90_008156 [Kerria lacca]
MESENLQNQIISIEFEVFGEVQGFYFTKYCRDKCNELGIVGWIKNSKKGTIIGKIQGKKIDIDKIIVWLSKKGSPGCHIEKCNFSNIEYLIKPQFKEFVLRF